MDEPEVEVPDLTNNEPVSSKRARKPPVKFVSDPIRGAKKSTVTNGKRAGVTKESAPIFTEEDESIAPVMTKKVVGARKRKQLEENLMDEPDVELSPGKPEGAAMPVESERQKRKTKPEVSKSNVTEPETLFESNQSVEEEGGAKGKKKPTKKAKVAELAAGTEDKDAPAEVKEKETVRKPSAKASKKKTFEAQEKIDQAASMSGDENGRNTEDSEKPNSDGEETRVLAVQDKPKSKRGAVPKKSEPVVKATRAPRQVKKRNVEPEEPKNEVAALKSNSDEDDKEDEPEPEVVQLKKGRREAKLRTGKADKANVEIKE